MTKLDEEGSYYTNVLVMGLLRHNSRLLTVWELDRNVFTNTGVASCGNAKS